MKSIRQRIRFFFIQLALMWRAWERLMEKSRRGESIDMEKDRVVEIVLRARHIKELAELKAKKRILADLKIIDLICKANKKYEHGRESI